MKIRTDFVTNSSSSSFIVGFNSMDEINEMAEYIKDYKGRCHGDIFADRIPNGIVSYEEVLKQIHEYFIENIYVDSVFENGWYGWTGNSIDCPYSYEWNQMEKKQWEMRSQKDCDYNAVQKLEDDFLNRSDVKKWFDKYKKDLYDSLIQKVQGKSIYSIVEFDDHTDGDMEHEVMPDLKCTLIRMSHH